MYEVIGTFCVLLVTGFFCWVIYNAFFYVSNSKKYRQELADMYVAAKVREIASKESVDLNKEYLQFLDWNKRNTRNLKQWNFDQTIEEELKEKISKEIKPLKKQEK